MTDDGQEEADREDARAGPPMAPSDVEKLQPAPSESVTLIDAD